MVWVWVGVCVSVSVCVFVYYNEYPKFLFSSLFICVLFLVLSQMI